jgi:cardiolipin synthase A/B
VDGTVAFVGGLNVGDEYVGKVPRFGFWRDTHFRLEGPVVRDLQRLFVEDWDFAAGEYLTDPPDAEPGRSYFQTGPGKGEESVQVVESGPDRDLKPIREVYFAAILSARKRLWIASPYFVPDAGLRDALRLAGHLGVDVRLLGQFHPDKWIPLYAARYYWTEMLEAGVKVYQYTRGMLHSKVMLVDGRWASVGTANLDNRSLHLNFELSCLLYNRELIDELAARFECDLQESMRLDPEKFAKRGLGVRLVENGCRLFAPIL